jgi:hypothetical protein
MKWIVTPGLPVLLNNFRKQYKFVSYFKGMQKIHLLLWKESRMPVYDFRQLCQSMCWERNIHDGMEDWTVWWVEQWLLNTLLPFQFHSVLCECVCECGWVCMCECGWVWIYQCGFSTCISKFLPKSSRSFFLFLEILLSNSWILIFWFIFL